MAIIDLAKMAVANSTQQIQESYQEQEVQGPDLFDQLDAALGEKLEEGPAGDLIKKGLASAGKVIQRGKEFTHDMKLGSRAAQATKNLGDRLSKDQHIAQMYPRLSGIAVGSHGITAAGVGAAGAGGYAAGKAIHKQIGKGETGNAVYDMTHKPIDTNVAQAARKVSVPGIREKAESHMHEIAEKAKAAGMTVKEYILAHPKAAMVAGGVTGALGLGLAAKKAIHAMKK